MAITANIVQSHKNAGAAGTVLGTQTIAAPANWTRLTSLNNTIPTSGALLSISSDAEAFRFAIMPPESSANTSQADRLPRDSGELVPSWGAGSTEVDAVPFGSQVWVKQA
jgi:hypothetical protein